MAAYTGHSSAAPFAAQSRPTIFPLGHAGVRRDNTAAHAVCLALTRVNACVERLAAMPTATPDDLNELKELLCKDTATPLGHVLRVLAAEALAICKDRRQVCLDTVADPQGRLAMDQLPPSSTHLFDGDKAIRHRQDIRGPFKTEAPHRNADDHNQRRTSSQQRKRPASRDDTQTQPPMSSPFDIGPTGQIIIIIKIIIMNTFCVPFLYIR